MNKNRKIKSEQDTRQGLINYAKIIGAQEDLQQLFDRWDRIIALAPENEKIEMSRMAILEIQRLLDIYPDRSEGLTINDETVYNASKEKHDAILTPVSVKQKK